MHRTCGVGFDSMLAGFDGLLERPRNSHPTHMRGTAARAVDLHVFVPVCGPNL